MAPVASNDHVATPALPDVHRLASGGHVVSTSRLVVALDGPSGSGKSTVGRGVARALGWRYVDTGATYRAATLAALRAGADLTDAEQILAAVQAATITLTTDPAGPAVHLDGENVSQEVRGAAVTAAVSAVSAVAQVRELMVALQRAAAGEQGAVVDGRDIAQVVLPHAMVKIYLDASPEVRAARRTADPAGAGIAALQAVAADLARRDHLDSTRLASPLRVADDAVHVNSDVLTAAEVVSLVLALVAEAGADVPAES